jgi:hypothetical protein
MDAFSKELMRRSPLAAAVLETCDFLFDDQWLTEVYDAHRGKCYTDKLTFGRFLALTRDALLRHKGSAHQLFIELEADQSHPIDESNFYRKLSRTPAALSRALLRDSAARLSSLMPAMKAALLPGCFDGFEVFAADGKTIRQVAMRLKPTRGYSAKMLGGKALIALNLRSGLAIAMSDTLDGMSNEVPLAPALIEQLHQATATPMLTLWDRQFDDFTTFTHLRKREGDAFVARVRKGGLNFTVESRAQCVDDQGRGVIDETGTFVRTRLQPQTNLRLRRVTLARGDGEEDVILMTNLSDRATFGAAELLELYRHRWRIEQVFQQITQTFSLEHLIGCGPKATLFQLAYCLLLYNLTQVIKAYLAEDGGVLPSIISTFYLFQNMRKELEAWAYHGDGPWRRAPRDIPGMRQRLAELLKGQWNAKRYTKASDKKPRGKPRPPQRLNGTHVSVQRVLEGRVEVIAQ